MYSQKPKRFQKLRDWARRHKSTLLLGCALALIVGTGVGVAAYMYFAPEPIIANVTIPKKKPKPPEKPKSPLTGVEVADEATTRRQVTAIMLENSLDARPQSGLKQAGVVYEAIAEGGITRFLCLYQEARPGLIGPVRSLRPYYVDWLAAYDAVAAHIGGSKNALAEIRNGSYKDLDQFFNAGAYWRTRDRAAPHNVYTSFDKLDEVNKQKGFTGSNFTGFKRKPEAPPTSPNATQISVSMSSRWYDSSYAFDKGANSYIRSEGGEAHKDREDGQITPKVVIVMKVAMTRGFEDGYREQIATIGSGTAYVFQDGTVTEGTWNKADRKAPIVFKNSQNQEIALNPGQTWISAIPDNRGVSWQ